MHEKTLHNTAYPKSKKLWLTVLKITFSIFFIFFLINYVEYDKVVTILGKANILYILIVIILMATNIYYQFKKWELLVNNLIKEKSKKKILVSLFHGFAAGITTPVRSGEYFGRAIIFKEKPLSQIIIATAIEKFIMMILVVFVGSIISLLYLVTIGIATYLIIIIAVIAIILFALFAQILNSPGSWKKIIPHRIRKFKFVEDIMEKLQFLKNVNKKLIIKLVIFTVAAYFIYILQFGILLLSFSSEGNLINALWCGSLVMFVKTIIPAVGIGDLGIREGAAVFFSPALGFTEAAALNAALGLFFVNLFLPSVVGFILSFRKY
ncbi:MAG: lysylphosphatidylglycerol synthase domain-containing protein [Melioribacteraceae bacterium]|nr:flippase-like domain-containing protein [Melioribacteraceae bacterium]MDD3557810.1 lysylphosphatidylglycerol synthase domain-containing protein [Melioribacteraceae bacterium]